MPRHVLSGNRYKVSVFIRKERGQLCLKILDRATGRVLREVLSDLNPRQKTKAYARAAARQTALNGGQSAPAPETFDKARRRVLDLFSAEKRPATARKYAEKLRFLEVYLKERRPRRELYIEDVTPAVAREYLSWRRKRTDRQGRTVEASTVNSDLRHLHAAWSTMIALGLAVDNPWRDVPRLHEMKRLHVRLTWPQRERLLAAATGMDLKFNACLALALDTGARAGELSHVTWRNIDLSARVWLITKEGDWLPKDFEEGILPFGPDAGGLLAEWRNRRVADLMTDGLTADEARAWLAGSRVFGTGRTGGADEWERTFNGLLSKACDAAGVPRARCHDLRRTVARLSSEAGASAQDVQAMLRHSAFATTKGYIGDDQSDAAARAFAALNSKNSSQMVPIDDGPCEGPDSDAPL